MTSTTLERPVTALLTEDQAAARIGRTVKEFQALVAIGEGRGRIGPGLHPAQSTDAGDLFTRAEVEEWAETRGYIDAAGRASLTPRDVAARVGHKAGGRSTSRALLDRNKWCEEHPDAPPEDVPPNFIPKPDWEFVTVANPKAQPRWYPETIQKWIDENGRQTRAGTPVRPRRGGSSTRRGRST